MLRPWKLPAHILLLATALASAASAAERYVAPTGSPRGAGTKASPWDIEFTLGGGQKINPGDTVWLRGGTYKKPFEVAGHGFKVQLAGKPGAPIQIRGVPGERVTIDGGLSIMEPSTYLWIRDLEITVSEPRPEKPVPPDPTYRAVNRPWGGLNINTGAGCKYINLVIHNNNQGVSFWSGATDSELYGCLIYDNGWAATDRGHGHAIYTQNRTGIKTIADCIMTGGYSYSLHAYGSERADIDNYHVEGNIVYNAGPFLIGGGKPSRNIHVLRNYLYNVNMRLGYSAPQNEDLELRGNLIAKGDLTINKFSRVVNENNRVVKEADPRPKGAQIVLRPNRYDPRRAHLAIFNWDRKTVVAVQTATFLKRGDRFRLMDPRDFYGKPLLTGTHRGGPLRVPVAGEFAAFVLLKDAPRRGTAHGSPPGPPFTVSREP